MKRINIGCGMDYKEGFINVDFNHEIEADIYCDIEKEKLPFEENSTDYVRCSHFLEHMKDVFKVMDELWRVCKNGAIIEILSPHYTGTEAFKYPCHYNYFGINSFSCMEEEYDGNKQRYGKARLKILKQELHLFFCDSIKPRRHPYAHKFGSFFNIFNPLFNFGFVWKTFMEKLFIFGFEEIYYKLEVVK